MKIYRIIKIVFPKEVSTDRSISVTTNRIPITDSCSTVYDAVDSLRNKEFVIVNRENKHNHLEEMIELQEVLNIHNDSGIKDIGQIASMVRKIRSGEHIVSENGIPNAKLVRVAKSQWLLFDGHHSMLAYIHAGKKYLHEVAHLTVENEGVENHVSDDDIAVFFGKYAKIVREKDWRNYVINWQAQKNEQLCVRIQENMGELYKSLSNRIAACMNL